MNLESWLQSKFPQRDKLCAEIVRIAKESGRVSSPDGRECEIFSDQGIIQSNDIICPAAGLVVVGTVSGDDKRHLCIGEAGDLMECVLVSTEMMALMRSSKRDMFWRRTGLDFSRFMKAFEEGAIEEHQVPPDQTEAFWEALKEAVFELKPQLSQILTRRSRQRGSPMIDGDLPPADSPQNHDDH